VTDPRKPNLLMLTSSFPRKADDETCGYIRDFAREMADDFNVTVLTLPDQYPSDWPKDVFTLIRTTSLLPQRLNPLRAASDLAHLSERSFMVRCAAAISLAGFAFDALRLARHADVICSHWMLPSGLIGATVSRLWSRPHVVVEHSGALHLLRRMRGGRQLSRFILDGSHRVVTVSRDLKEKLLELCPAADWKVEVLPMGVDAAQTASTQKGISKEGRTALFVGRLTKIKGVDVLIKAARELGNLKLVIAGDGDEREPLQHLVNSLGVNAVFEGRVSAETRNDLLSKCDAVVIPSLVLPDGRTEGMPLICLEAMAAGKAVIASRVGGLRELIVDGQNGLLFDSGNHMMLAEKLDILFGDQSLGNSLSANARVSISQYDWSIVGSRYREILKSSLQPQESQEALCH